MDIRLKIIGVLRFSVLTPTYYSERFDSLDGIAEHIFSDERMALRFHLFETLCLPSLTRQTDDRFDLVVLTAERLPVRHMDRLRALLAPFPHIRLMPVGPDNHYQLIKAAYLSVPTGEASHRCMFRLDDDDAVDLGYIARLRRLASGALPVTGPKQPLALAFNRGFYVRRQPGGNEVFDAWERAPLSTGTALVAPLDYPRNPYRYNHRALAQHYTTLSDLSEPAFIRTIHGDNKSKPTQMGRSHKLRPDRIDTALRRHFGTDLARLEAL